MANLILSKEAQSIIEENIYKRVINKNLVLSESALNHIGERIDKTDLAGQVLELVKVPKDGEDYQITDTDYEKITESVLSKIIAPEGKQGEDGEKGAEGEKGQSGLKGIKGEKGDTGAPMPESEKLDLAESIKNEVAGKSVSEKKVLEIIADLIVKLKNGSIRLKNTSGGANGSEIVKKIDASLGTNWKTGIYSGEGIFFIKGDGTNDGDSWINSVIDGEGVEIIGLFQRIDGVDTIMQFWGADGAGSNIIKDPDGNSVWVFLIDEISGKTIIHTDLELTTGLASIGLGGVHLITSAGMDMVTQNRVNGHIHSSPSSHRDLPDITVVDDEVIISGGAYNPLSARVPTGEVHAVGVGVVDLNNTVQTNDLDRIASENTAIVGVVYRIAEDLDNVLLEYTVVDKATGITLFIESKLFTASAGEYIIFNFRKPNIIEEGLEYTRSLRNGDGETISVYSSSLNPMIAWASVIHYNFEDVDVIMNGEAFLDRIISPDELNTLINSNDSLTYNADAVDRLKITDSTLLLYSPNGVKYLRLQDNNFKFFDGEQDRLRISDSNSRLVSPDGLSEYKLTNIRTELIHNGSTKLHIESDYTIIFSGNRANFLALDNAGLVYNNSEVQNSSHKGTANGIVPLDGSSLISETYLPSYIDDVLDKYLDIDDTKGNGYDAFYDEASLTNKTAEEAGKIYIDITAGGSTSYRWSGSVYTQLSSGLVLGETSATAYRGDRGSVAYNHSQLAAEHIDWTDTTENISTEGKISATGGGETGRFLTGLAGSTVFSFTGSSFDIRAGNGTSSAQNVLVVTPTTLTHSDSTRNRLEVTAVHSKLFAPDGGYTLLDDDRLVYNDGTRNRLEINSTGAMFVSPSGVQTLIVGDTGVLYNMVEVATVDDLQGTYYVHPTGNGNLHVPANVQANDNAKSLVSGSDAGDYTWEHQSKIRSASGNNYMTVWDSGFALSMNANLIEGSYDNLILKSPNAVQHITIDDLEIKFQSGDDFLQLANSAFVHYDGLVNRQVIDTVKNHFIGPFGAHNLQITALGAYYDDVEIATVEDISPNWNTAFGWGDHADTYSLLDHTHAGGGSDRIISPDTFKTVIVSDTDFVYNDGTNERIDINEYRTVLTSPGLTTQFFADEDEVSMTFDGERRVEADNTTTSLRSPDGSFKLTITDSEVQFKDATSVRLRLTSSTSYLESANSQNYISIDNTQMYTVGYSKLGSGAPSIKMKKLAGTTNAVQGAGVSITHSLNVNKILSCKVLVDIGNAYIPPRYSGASSYEFTYYITSAYIWVFNVIGNSSNILSKGIKILITYEA